MHKQHGTCHNFALVRKHQSSEITHTHGFPREKVQPLCGQRILKGPQTIKQGIAARLGYVALLLALLNKSHGCRARKRPNSPSTEDPTT